MYLLSIVNKNFYILMCIVILILFFYSFKGCNQKKDKIVSRVLMIFYILTTFVLCILNFII